MFKLNIHKWILFISSYIPLYILLIIKDLVSRVEKYGIGCIKRFYVIDSINDIMIIILLLISVISFVYLKVMLNGVKGKTFILVDEVKDETSSNFLNYISMYLISCIGLTIATFTDVVTLVLVMSIIGYIYVRSNLLYINPIINVCNYNIYSLSGIAKGTGEKVETVLIAHKTLCVKRGDLLFTTNNTSFVFAVSRNTKKNVNK